MKPFLRFFSFLIFIIIAMPAAAQERPVRGTGIPDFGRNSLLININARVLEENTEVWNETQSKVTIHGRAVGIRLVGSNIVVAVQFTPYVRRDSNVMIAQSQIWIEDPGKGINYYTSIQTIPMELGEPIHFFPLGNSDQSNSSSIEIIITVNPNNSADNEN